MNELTEKDSSNTNLYANPGTFEWALIQMKNGEKVRRKHWHGKDFFVLKDNEFWSNEDIIPRFYPNELLEDDWELYEEPKTKVKYYPALVKWKDEPRNFIDAQETARYKSEDEARKYYDRENCNLIFIRLITEIPELIEEREQ